MKSKKKKNNNLILVKVGDRKNYYTSLTRAGASIGMASASVSWAIANGNIMTNEQGETVMLSIVDGSEIPYKLINN